MLQFLAGLFLSMTGSIPPGIISLSVAQTSIQRGVQAAMFLAVGAAFAEFFQAWLAVEASGWFLQHPAVGKIFEWASLPIFFGLGLYFLLWAKVPTPQGRTANVKKGMQFFKGIVISVFNLLAIPYWFTYCGWLRVNGWWKEGLFYSWIFSLGVVIGTTISLSLYAWMADYMVKKSDKVGLYANRTVGVIFIALALKLLWTVLFG